MFGCIIEVAVAGVVFVPPLLLPVVVAFAVVLERVVFVVWPSVMIAHECKKDLLSNKCNQSNAFIQW